MLSLWLFCYCYICLCKQADDDIEWKVVKPEIYAVIMDFFASGLPVLTEEQPSGDTGVSE